MEISICIIATNRYKEYLLNLLMGIQKYFLVDHNVTCHLFIDEKEFEHKDKFDEIKIETHQIPSYGFPEATLKRFAIMTSLPRERYGDYLFYIDADMSVVDTIPNDIFAPPELENVLIDIIVVQHPGFFNKQPNNSWEHRVESNCYVKPQHRTRYVAGGINGGKRDKWYDAMLTMRKWIDADLENGIIPKWHDETALNAWVSINAIDSIIYLDPSYCMPEPESKRIAWGINNFKPKILALEKPKNFRV